VARGGDAALSRSEETLVEMTNGCSCCMLRDDLLQKARVLAVAGRFDYIRSFTPGMWMGLRDPFPAWGEQELGVVNERGAVGAPFHGGWCRHNRPSRTSWPCPLIQTLPRIQRKKRESGSVR